MYATLFEFGIKNNIGAGQLSDYFALLQIGTHLSISDSTIRRLLVKMEPEFSRYQAECEASATCASPEIVVGCDEVFLNSQPTLVLMELVSGYVIAEKTATNRSFETWHTLVFARLATLKVTVQHAISDRAKALIKLARDGFECGAGADLFHVQQDVGRWLSRSLGRATDQAKKSVEAAHQVVKTHEAKKDKDPKEAPRLDRLLKQAEQEQAACEQAQALQRQYRQDLSHAIHPFDIATGEAQDQTKVLATLEATLNKLEVLADSHEITDPKNKRDKIRKQLPDLACHVGVWWHWINSLLEKTPDDEVMRQWIVHYLMPVVYWHHQQSKTKKRTDREQYKAAWDKATVALKAHPLTPTLSEKPLADRRRWCEDKVLRFQRSSSAVEGRNGCLAQMYHNGRGITPSRLEAHTVLHNYWIRRRDNSTAAERLYAQPFPDLFEWLLERMDEWPLPRKRKSGVKPNSLIGVSVSP